MKIFFLEKSIPFSSLDLNSFKIGGTEKTLINISNELAKYKNLEIKVFNNVKKRKLISNVEWVNINDYDYQIEPDILIAFSDANLFKNYKSKKKFLWSHSVQNLEKFIRKKQLISYLKHKPVLILEGDYHFKTRPFLTSFFGKKILKLAPDYEFIDESVNIDFFPEKKCIFSTKSDRNLDILLKAWSEIYKFNNDAKLYINPPFKLSEAQIKQNIFLREKGNKKNLINDLKNSRIMLVPGHKGEVYCLAAEEARELCIPIVTLGYGSLNERVIHNKTGFIANDINEFINFSLKLLNDDELYLQIRKNLFNIRNTRNYSHVASDLLNISNINF
ncbi:glycosyltransferase [Candidatus Pelagibacter sp.]|nr:glycosyltransferase [Candidatus Pelagibacter sp.]